MPQVFLDIRSTSPVLEKLKGASAELKPYQSKHNGRTYETNGYNKWNRFLLNLECLFCGPTESDSLPRIEHNGRIYELIGTDKNECSKWDRFCLGLECLFFEIITLGTHPDLTRNWRTAIWNQGETEIYALVKEARDQASVQDVPNSLIGERDDKDTLFLALKSATEADWMKEKKQWLFQNALRIIQEQNIDLALVSFRLARAEEFDLSKTHTPQYFTQIFRSDNQPNFSTTVNFYDYLGKPQCVDYHTIFANARLGGGIFHDGFVQEEIIGAIAPALAAYNAKHLDERHKCTIFTREPSHVQANEQILGRSNIPAFVSGQTLGNPDREEVMKGSPRPILFQKVHIIQWINDIYGTAFRKISLEQLKPKVQETNRSIAPTNFVAIAAPRLLNNNPEIQWHPDTLKDLFNTVMSALELVKQTAKQERHRPLWHSGQIGCGVFNNSPKAAYLIQRLAAQHMGIDTILHGYKDEEVKEYSKVWDDLEENFKDRTLEHCIDFIHMNQR